MDVRTWSVCDDPGPMLGFLRGKASERKLRLFACACCRRVWHLLTDERSRQAVEVAERFADGLESRMELATVRVGARAVARAPAVPSALHQYKAAQMAEIAVADALPVSIAQGVTRHASAGYTDRWAEGLTAQAHLVRDIFNPFAAVTVDPTWLSWHEGMIAQLAQAAYEERELPAGTMDRARLANLAFALEEAGCTEANLTGHLREPWPHVRGCWVVDLLLGRE